MDGLAHLWEEEENGHTFWSRSASILWSYLVPVYIIWCDWSIQQLAKGKVILNDSFWGPQDLAYQHVHPLILAVLKKLVGGEQRRRGNCRIERIHIRCLQGVQCKGQRNPSPNFTKEIKLLPSSLFNSSLLSVGSIRFLFFILYLGKSWVLEKGKKIKVNQVFPSLQTPHSAFPHWRKSRDKTTLNYENSPFQNSCVRRCLSHCGLL